MYISRDQNSHPWQCSIMVVSPLKPFHFFFTVHLRENKTVLCFKNLLFFDVHEMQCLKAKGEMLITCSSRVAPALASSRAASTTL